MDHDPGEEGLNAQPGLEPGHNVPMVTDRPSLEPGHNVPMVTDWPDLLEDEAIDDKEFVDENSVKMLSPDSNGGKGGDGGCSDCAPRAGGASQERRSQQLRGRGVRGDRGRFRGQPKGQPDPELPSDRAQRPLGGTTRNKRHCVRNAKKVKFRKNTFI